MKPEELKRVQVRLEAVASQNRRPLPDQDAIASDLLRLCNELEALVAELAPEGSAEYSPADIWFSIQLIAEAEGRLADVIST